MSSKDYLGYYNILGINSNSTANEIKAAYRRMAMDLHPDRNQGKDTTAEFQKLQKAYEILSNEKLRQKYDADSSVPPTQSTNDQDSYKSFDPIVCSVCSAVTAQPRYKVFYSVISYFFGATRRPHQGIFCSKCEVKTAIKASAITMIVGWWSIPGFIWSFMTLFENLVGGSFYLQNAKLQSYQAMYFARVGKVDLARAVAQESLNLINKILKSNLRHTKFEQSIDVETESQLGSLKNTLEDYIKSFPPEVKSIEIKPNNIIFNKRFNAQIALLVVFFGIIAGYTEYVDIQESNREAARLEQQGIKRAQAAAVAAREAIALKSLEQPLPLSGPYSIPGNAWYSRDSFPTLKVNNSPEVNTLLKLYRQSSKTELMSIFIRAGDSVEVAVPPGTYVVKVASGNTWYGEPIWFGRDTSYGKLDSIFTFSIEGGNLRGHELTLKLLKDGNLTQTKISANDF